MAFPSHPTTTQVTAAGTTPNATKPAETVAGDLMLADILVYDSTSDVITAPAGWVELATHTWVVEGVYQCRYSLYAKVAGASEPSTYQWTVTSPVTVAKQIGRYPGAAGIPTAITKTVNTSTTGVTFNPVTTSGTDALVALIGFSAQASGTDEWAQAPITGVTLASTNDIGFGTGTQQQASPGASVARTGPTINPHNAGQIAVAYTVAVESPQGPDTTAPTITSANAASVLEGEPFSLSLTANEAVTWSIVGGSDSGHFGLTGNVLSLAGKSFSAPADSDGNNTYAVTIRATDAASNTTDQTIVVTVTQVPIIRFVGSATGTNSAVIPAHRANDLIRVFAFRDGSTTAPTLPTGQDWTSLNAPGGTNTCSMRLADKIADSDSEATGTFTGATSLIVHVYRPRPGYALSAGAGSTNAGSSTTVNYPGITLQDTSGNSIVTAFAGHRSTNTALETAPAGMVARSSVVDATDEASGHDTNGGVTSWASINVSVGGTASGWWSVIREIRATAIVVARRAFSYACIID